MDAEDRWLHFYFMSLAVTAIIAFAAGVITHLISTQDDYKCINGVLHYNVGGDVYKALEKGCTIVSDH